MIFIQSLNMLNSINQSKILLLKNELNFYFLNQLVVLFYQTFIQSIRTFLKKYKNIKSINF